MSELKRNLDEALWVRLKGDESRSLISGNALTFPGRFLVTDPATGRERAVSQFEIEESSEASARWIEGFMWGCAAQPPRHETAKSRWRGELERFFDSQGRVVPLEFPVSDLDLDYTSYEMSVDSGEVASAAIAFLDTAREDDSRSKMESVKVDIPLLRFGVDSDEQPRLWWNHAFRQLLDTENRTSRRSELPLLSEQGGWCAVQYFFENYPDWADLSAARDDLLALTRDDLVDESLENAWTQCTGLFSLPELESGD